MKRLTSDEKNQLLFQKILDLRHPESKSNSEDEFRQLCASTIDVLWVNLTALQICDVHNKIARSKKMLGKEFGKAYHDILNRWIMVLNQLNITDPLEISNFFSLLLWNGYLSQNKSLCYQSNDRFNLLGWHSLDVINGHGVCLNFCDMLKDLLNKMSVDAALLINYTDNLYRDNIAGDLVSRNIKPEKARLVFKFFNLLLKKHGNHAFVVIRDQNKLFAYDPTNLMCADIKNINRANVIDGKGKYDLKLEASYAYAQTEREYKALDCVFEQGGIASSYTKSDINDSWINAYYLFKNNQELLDECYQGTLPAVKYICKKIENKRSK